MARETTLVLVKPDGMRRGLAGEIVARFERRGLELRGARLLKIPKSTAREHYAELYALPGAMHSGFMQFAAFDQDAVDNQAFLAKGKLAMPVLAVGGEKSFGKTMARIMEFAAHGAGLSRQS